MLQTIRNNSRGILAKIFIGFVILVFALFGLESIVGTIVNSSTAVTVNGEDISEAEIENETQRQLQQLLGMLGDDFDPSGLDVSMFREMAINNLIEQRLLLQFAANHNMTIDARTLDRQIAQTPDFQINGVFNSERAQAVLRSVGFTPASYRAALQREGVLNQLLNAYSLSSFATAAELDVLAVLTNQRRNFRYLQIPSSQLALAVEIADADIEAYYEANQAMFMLGERVALEYIEVDRNALAAEFEVSEEAVRARYEQEIALLSQGMERRASHILLQAANDEQFRNALALAEELKGRIDAGESFEELAAEYSDDTFSARNGGDVGYTSGDTFAPAFETALRGLGLNEVSDPVRTNFGIHLIKLTEQTDIELPAFEDSRERIAQELLAADLDRSYRNLTEELSNLSFESIDLRDPAEILGLEIRTTELFDRNGGAGIAASNAVVNAAFRQDILEDGLNSDLIQISDTRSVVVRLLERREPELRPLAQVRGEVEAALRNERAREQARSIGNTLAGNLRSGQNINALLETQGLSWNQINELQRSNQLGLDPDLANHVFRMTAPEESEGESTRVIDTLQLANGDYAVIELQNVITGSVDDFDEQQRRNLENFVHQQAANYEINALVTGMMNRADINR